MRFKGDSRVRANRAHHPAARMRRDGGDAFIKDPWGGHARARTNDDFAESLAEQFVGSATTAQSSDAGDDIPLPEEMGGPFITTRARLEFARGVDPSNPLDAEPEALPTVVVGLVGESPEDDEEK